MTRRERARETAAAPCPQLARGEDGLVGHVGGVEQARHPFQHRHDHGLFPILERLELANVPLLQGIGGGGRLVAACLGDGKVGLAAVGVGAAAGEVAARLQLLDEDRDGGLRDAHPLGNVSGRGVALLGHDLEHPQLYRGQARRLGEVSFILFDRAQDAPQRDQAGVGPVHAAPRWFFAASTYLSRGRQDKPVARE